MNENIGGSYEPMMGIQPISILGGGFKLDPSKNDGCAVCRLCIDLYNIEVQGGRGLRGVPFVF